MAYTSKGIKKIEVYGYAVPATVAVTGVTLDSQDVMLTVGATLTLAATVSPDNASNTDVTWSVTEGSEYVTLCDEDGAALGSDALSGDKPVTVKGIAEGEATIMVTSSESADIKATCTVTVSKITPTITTPSTASDITYGQTLSGSTLTGGMATANGTNVSGIFAWASPDVVPAVGTTQYAVVFTPMDTATYTSADCQVTVTIARAEATVTAEDKSKTYGADDPTLTASVTGLVNGEDASVISYTLSRAAGENVGTYAITPSGTAEQGNYAVTFEAGTLTVNKAASSVTAAPTAIPGLTYTGTAQALVRAGAADGGTMQYALGGGEYGTAVPMATNTGSYTVSYKVVGDANHTDTAAQSLTVTISPKPGEEKSDPDPTPTPDPDPTPAEDKTTAVIGDGDNAKAKSISELLSDKSLDQKEITTAKIENASSLASLSGIGKLEKLETLSISGANNLTDISEVKTLKNLKTLDVSSCPSLETANLSGNTSLTEVKMNECEALTELDVSNCPELVSLDVSSGDLKTLNVNGCSKLASLNCASNTLPALSLSGCTKLTSLDCSENSLLSLDLSSLGSLASVDCHGQYRGDLISIRQSDGTWRVELPEGLASGTVRIAAAGFVTASVRAYDEAGNLLTPTTAGTYTDQPVRITYNYNTGYNDGEKEVLMDVTLSGEPSGPTGPTSNKGSGGCDTIGLGGVALMTLAGLAFKNRRWRRSRCFARS